MIDEAMELQFQVHMVLEIAHGNLRKILSQKLNNVSLNLTLIFEYKVFELLTTQSCKMKQKCEISTSM